MSSGNNVIDIIIPVYDGLADVKACLQSVFTCRLTQPVEVIVIWDCGPDPRLYEYLLNLRKQHDFTYLENATNLGFVKTVNRGMQLHVDRDTVLLNSDTIVANDWLDRLLACAGTDSRIATVTPFSNNAEICSFPEICRANKLPAGWTTAKLDALFARWVTPAAIDIPTGVGFCMFIRRAALQQVGYFNEEIFKRGYGEENDFCRKAAALGFRNVHCTNVFVTHIGGISFAGEKQTLVEHAMRILDKRHPDYHGLVHAFIGRDPAMPYRVQAALALVKATDKPALLMHTHNLGGGTDRYVSEIIGYLADKLQILVLRPVSDRQLELSLPWPGLRLYFDIADELPLLAETCRQIGVARLHIQHIMGVEASVKVLIEQLDLPYDITLHDYFFINGNPTLTDEKGRYYPPGDGLDAHCAQRYPIPLGMSADQWRAYTSSILAGADRVIVPSQFAATLYAEYFSDIQFRFVDHPEIEKRQRYAAVKIPVVRAEEKLRVAVLGALSLEKGADILDGVAKLAKERKLPLEFHLVGYAYRPLSSAVITHGPYQEEQLDDLLLDLNPHCMWFPCQWPETYSYTLSACLRLGLPVIAPNLGAFPERLAGRPGTHVFPVSEDVSTWLEELSEYVEEDLIPYAGHEFGWEQDRTVAANAPPSFYRVDYVMPIRAMHERAAGLPDIATIVRLLQNDKQLSVARQRKENALRFLINLRSLPVARLCVRLIPVEWQRKLKRKLSPKPLHEIAR